MTGGVLMQLLRENEIRLRCTNRQMYRKERTICLKILETGNVTKI